MAKKNSHKGKSCNQDYTAQYVSIVIGACERCPQNPHNPSYFSEFSVSFSSSKVYGLCG